MQEAMTLNLWPMAKEFGGPVKLIGADPRPKGLRQPLRQTRHSATEGGYDYSCVEGTGHLLQIEKPEECFRLSAEFIRAHGLA